MKSGSVTRLLGLFAVAAGLSSAAIAEDSKWYMGANVGRSMAKIDDIDHINRTLFGSGLTVTNISDDERDTGYKLFAGYQFHENWAVEGGYFDLGKFGYSATTVPAGTIKARLETHGLNLSLVGMKELTEKWSMFGRVGVNWAETDVDFTGGGLVNILSPKRDDSSTNANVGVGFQYDINRSLGLRFELERFRIDDTLSNRGDFDLASIGLVYRFGQTGSKPIQQAAEVAPVAALPPKPVVVVVPVTESTEQYCTILDFRFEINQSDVQAVDLEKLAVVGTFMNKYPGTTAIINGHTDNVGLPADNLKLSQKRADSVVTFLVKEHGIKPSRLKAVGYGQSSPVASNDTPEGMRANRRLNAVVACATDIEGLKPVTARLTMALQMGFNVNNADVKPEFRDELESVAKFMRANPTVDATIQGHTSNQTNPSIEESMKLSRSRATSVANYLVDNFGIERSRLKTEGFGSTRRYSYNTSLEGQLENQRVNIIFTYKK